MSRKRNIKKENVDGFPTRSFMPVPNFPAVIFSVSFGFGFSIPYYSLLLELLRESPVPQEKALELLPWIFTR